MENSTADTPVKYAGENGLQASGAQAVEQQRAIAEVQGAIISAKKFPRDVVGAIERIKVACQRPTLAAQALYSYGKGGSEVTGPSIRLMEAVAQNYGNISCGVIELARANGSSECLAYAWDMETNFRDEKKFTVRHWRDTKSGGYPLKDERDIYELIANMGARRKRACLMAVIPGDVVEDAATQCDETLRAKVQITPERIKSMAEAFAAFSVTSEQLEKRIQRKLESIQPAQMVSLGKILNSLKDGMSKAADWFDAGSSGSAVNSWGTLVPVHFAKAKEEITHRISTADEVIQKAMLDPNGEQAIELRRIEKEAA